MALEFGAGCVGGAAGVAVGHPFDTIKVRLQTQCPKNPQYSGAIDCIRQTVKVESLRGLYKGMSSPMAGVSVINALIFGVHGNIMKKMKDPSALQSHAIAGGGAGLFQAFITSPMELTKLRMQIQESMGMKGLYKNPLHCIATIFKTEGMRGIFRGQGITVLREVPGFTTYFFTYEYLVRQFSSGGEYPSAGAILMAGGLAGTASWVFTYPIDVLKSRLQADGMGGAAKYRGMSHCLRAGLAQEGSSFLTRGLGTTIVRAFPTNAATFFVVSWVMKLGENIGFDEAENYTLREIIEKGENLVSSAAAPVMSYVTPSIIDLKSQLMMGNLNFLN